MDQFTAPELYVERLAGMPREFLLAFAFRSALRVLPIALLVEQGEDAFTGKEFDSNGISAASLRAAIISYCCLSVSSADAFSSANRAAFGVVNFYKFFLNSGMNYSQEDKKFVDGKRGSTYFKPALNALECAARAGYSSAVLVQARDASTDAARSLLEFIKEGAAPNADIEGEYKADLDDLESGGHVHLLAQPLWRRGMPPRILEQWNSARNSLWARQAGFEIWVDWYERRLRGDALGFPVADEKADIAICHRFLEKDKFLSNEKDGWWPQLESDETAIAVNSEIASWITDIAISTFTSSLRILNEQLANGRGFDLSPPRGPEVIDNALAALEDIKNFARKNLEPSSLGSYSDYPLDKRMSIGGNNPPEHMDSIVKNQVYYLIHSGTADTVSKEIVLRIESLESAISSNNVEKFAANASWFHNFIQAISEEFSKTFPKTLAEKSAEALVDGSKALAKWIFGLSVILPSVLYTISKVLEMVRSH